MTLLPVDIDASFADDASRPGVKLHQQYHDVLHGLNNDLKQGLFESPKLVVRKPDAGSAANLQEWQDDAGAIKSAILSDGSLLIPNRVAVYGDTNADVNTQRIYVGTGAAGNRGLIVAGAAGQTANLAEFQNSSGSVRAAVGPDGTFSFMVSGLGQRTLEVGAPDSGGAGYRLVRVAN